MDVFGGGTGNSSAGALFDASQYAFFGGDVVEEVELGGLDEEEELPPLGFDADLYGVNDEEDAGVGTFSEIDDLTNSFSKFTSSSSSQPTFTGEIDHRVSQESSTGADWPKDVEYSEWLLEQNGQQLGSNSLYRASSYPDPQPQLHHSSTSIPVPKSSFPSYPPNGGMPLQGSPNSHFQHPNAAYVAGQPQLSHQNISPFPRIPTGLPQSSRFGGNLSHSSPPGLSVNSQPPGLWANQAMYHGEQRPNAVNMLQQQFLHQNGLSQQQLARPNGLMPQTINQQQQRQQNPGLPHPIHPNFNHLTGLYPQIYSPHLSASPPAMSKFEGMLGHPEMREQRPKSLQRIDHNSQRFDGGWQRYRSKYMAPYEIESIIRTQIAATQGNDPYVDDYYHQACLAKKSDGKRHFCPNVLRDHHSHARPSDEPHAFLQVEALGRIPFASVRRPRPLLEVEPVSSSASGSEQKAAVKSLEQEPLLAARVAIEDGISVLLDVDDIDRVFQFNQLPDGGIELKQRRKALLEELANSFQLVNPLSKDVHTAGLAPNDDLVFLRIISLPKGRKLLTRYLVKLSPDDELLRNVCMAIFRHLRFLFGVPISNPAIAETTAKLAATVSSRVCEMDLYALSACLAAVVCSSEQPPLRPMGSSNGDGATMILRCVLERATELLRDPLLAASPNRKFWQNSFKEFFELLTRYCCSKYDSITRPFQQQVSLNSASVESDLVRAIKKEMPVELLRASLPHTNDLQKKQLMEFAKRSVSSAGAPSHG